MRQHNKACERRDKLPTNQAVVFPSHDAKKASAVAKQRQQKRDALKRKRP